MKPREQRVTTNGAGWRYICRDVLKNHALMQIEPLQQRDFPAAKRATSVKENGQLVHP